MADCCEEDGKNTAGTVLCWGISELAERVPLLAFQKGLCTCLVGWLVGWLVG